ncbi:MAG: hypothetical protein AB7U52_03630 [Candidatus Izemoplasmatales bacterium]
MRRTEYLSEFSHLFDWVLIPDDRGNELVIINVESQDYLDTIKVQTKIQNNTHIEGFYNHVHILDEIKKNEIDSLCESGKRLGKSLLLCLCQKYPEKKFIVFVTISLGGSMTARFHQQWPNKPFYFDIEMIQNQNERLLYYMN